MLERTLIRETEERSRRETKSGLKYIYFDINSIKIIIIIIIKMNK